MSYTLHLVLGGARSGKSRYAEKAAAASGMPVCFIATYHTGAMDQEMRVRVEEHRTRRPKHWKTIENRFDLINLVRDQDGSLLLLDCLTLWLSFHAGQRLSGEVILADLRESLIAACSLNRSLIVVSNEVGMGLVPVTAEGRSFRDLCGAANQLAASCATKVELIVAGLPLAIKGGG